MHYYYGLDLSLSNSGIAIFNDEKEPQLICSVDTDSKQEYALRIQKIVNKIMGLIKQYPPVEIAYERGFSRFYKSTQALYRVQGAVMCALADYPQYFYPPSSVKKHITGKGNASKDLVEESVSNLYPDIVFNNQDESDALAVLITHLDAENKEDHRE